jgi:hypothetical protein
MVEDTNPAPSIASSIGPGWLLFSEILHKHYPSFKTEFLETTAMRFEQYFTCVCGLPFARASPRSREKVSRTKPSGVSRSQRAMRPAISLVRKGHGRQLLQITTGPVQERARKLPLLIRNFLYFSRFAIEAVLF